MSEAGVVDWDEAALEEMLNGPGGLVADFLLELSTQGAMLATTLVHVRPGTRSSATTGRTSNARYPGFTKARIRPHLAWGASTGKVYAGMNAPADPTIFLEKPARQLNRAYPFLTTALWGLEGSL